MERIREDFLESNQYWISHNRYLELKYFCLQYKEWKDIWELANTQTLGEDDDPTAVNASIKADCEHCIKLVENSAKRSDPVLAPYILQYATDGKSYNWLKLAKDIPCGRDLFLYYCRKFFWLLSNEKGV